MLARYAAAMVIVLAPALVAAQQPNDSAPVTVRLEPHDGRTEFYLDDAIFLDLVFAGGGAGYQVDTDASPAQAIGDQVYVSPEQGWTRTHQTVIGNGINGNASVPLAGGTVRVPVLINRVILFQKPGDYDISIATQRLVRDLRRVETYDDCDPCPGTNSVRIYVKERDENEESALVTSLSKSLEATQVLEVDRSAVRQELERMDERFSAMPDSPQEEAEMRSWLEKAGHMEEESERELDRKQAQRREAAERLAYLSSDDAVRAKVHFIAENAPRYDNDPVAFIMIDGFAASRNKKLQLDLMEALWLDPDQLPNDKLHAALHDARELVHSSMVRNNLALDDEERKLYWDQYAKDLDAIVPTLPNRSEANREKTVQLLKETVLPNRINHRTTLPGQQSGQP